MDLLKTIVQQLPYSRPFLFVDELTALDGNGCEGFYTFLKDEYFYQGHFKNDPVTPGVILTECMAQIGLVCLGIYLVKGLPNERHGSKFKDLGPVILSDSSEAGIVSKDGETKSVTLSGSPARRSVSKGETPNFVFSESNVLFEKAIYPGERVKVVSQKIYWRLGKLKCRVEMFNEAGERVASGELSGVIASLKYVTLRL